MPSAAQAREIILYSISDLCVRPSLINLLENISQITMKLNGASMLGIGGKMPGRDFTLRSRRDFLLEVAVSA
jgi:hypothetical protein